MLDADPKIRTILGLCVLALLVAVGLFSFFLFGLRIKREMRDGIAQDHDKSGSVILNTWIREWYFEKIRAFEELFIKHRFTPNALTVMGVSISCAAGVLYHFQLIASAGWMVLVAGTFDILDGAIARKTGQNSKSGAYFDSVLDRYAEMVVYAGILSYYLQKGSWLLWMVVLAMVGAQMVSYTRAKAENAGVESKRGIMQRPERFVYLGFGSILSSYFNAGLALWLPQEQYLLAATIIFIGVMSNITAWQRFRSAFLQLKKV